MNVKLCDIAATNNFPTRDFELFVTAETNIKRTGLLGDNISDRDVELAVRLYREKVNGIKKKEEEKVQLEVKKQEYARSFNEYYEYDVVTIVNEDHGRIDKEKMLKILGTRSSQGWRLHSVYSNELGKDALRVLGFGVNSTACEDVLIFERRVEKLP